MKPRRENIKGGTTEGVLTGFLGRVGFAASYQGGKAARDGLSLAKAFMISRVTELRTLQNSTRQGRGTSATDCGK